MSRYDKFLNWFDNKVFSAASKRTVDENSESNPLRRIGCVSLFSFLLLAAFGVISLLSGIPFFSRIRFLDLFYFLLTITTVIYVLLIVGEGSGKGSLVRLESVGGGARLSGHAEFLLIAFGVARNIPIDESYAPYIRLAAWVIFGSLIVQAVVGILIKRPCPAYVYAGPRTNLSDRYNEIQVSWKFWRLHLASSLLLFLIFGLLGPEVERSLLVVLKYLTSISGENIESTHTFFGSIRDSISEVFGLVSKWFGGS